MQSYKGSPFQSVCNHSALGRFVWSAGHSVYIMDGKSNVTRGIVAILYPSFASVLTLFVFMNVSLTLPSSNDLANGVYGQQSLLSSLLPVRLQV